MATTTTNMALQSWDQVGDIYDHTQLANNWSKLDQHNHTSGKGLRIPTDGIEDGAITADKLSSVPLINTAQLIDGSVTTAKILDGTILVGDLADDAVEAAKIKDNAVTTAKILNANVTPAKLSATSKVISASATGTSTSLPAGTPTDLAGVTVTVNPTVSVLAIVLSTFKIAMTLNPSNVCTVTGTTKVNGVAESDTAIFQVESDVDANTDNQYGASVSVNHLIPLTAGSYTIKLTGTNAISGGSAGTVSSENSSIKVILLPT